MRYPLEPLPRKFFAPPPSIQEEAEARLREELRAAGRACMDCRLVLRLYRLRDAGSQALAPLLAHLGWPLTGIAEDCAPEEFDALDELLLLCFKPGHALLTPGDLILWLFSLFQDTPRFATTRLGNRCISVEGCQISTEIIRNQPFGGRELNLLLAIWLRDRLRARKRIYDACGLVRLRHDLRRAIAQRLDMP